MYKLYTTDVAREKQKEWDSNIPEQKVVPFKVLICKESLQHLKYRYERQRNDKRKQLKETRLWMY